MIYMTQIYFFCMRTISNTSGPDYLPGPKALDPSHCRKPTLWLHNFCLKVLTVHSNELRLFWTKVIALFILLMSRIWLSSSRYNFFSYYAVWVVHLTNHLIDAEQIHYLFCNGGRSSLRLVIVISGDFYGKISW